MSLFFESIKVLDGEIVLADYHQNRMSKTILNEYGINKSFDLKSTIEIPCDKKKGLYKLKIGYSKYLEYSDLSQYIIKNHKKVLLFENNDIEYDYKYSNREMLDFPLTQNLDCDDVIFIKNKVLTDANYSNIILYDGQNWFTPATHLLNGVKRQFLLETSQLQEKKILFSDLASFQKIAFINAMRDFEKVYEFEICENHLLLNPSL